MFKARGGPVRAGSPYFVGDNKNGSINSTTELFIPNRSGTVVPASETISAVREVMGGGDSSSMSSAGQAVAAARAAMARQVTTADRNMMQQEIARETASMGSDSRLRVETFNVGDMRVVTEDQMLAALAQSEKRSVKIGEARVMRRFKNDVSVPGIR